jgi:hypothetical protein
MALQNEYALQSFNGSVLMGITFVSFVAIASNRMCGQEFSSAFGSCQLLVLIAD